jgi:hypothetical protein
MGLLTNIRQDSLPIDLAKSIEKTILKHMP